MTASTLPRVVLHAFEAARNGTIYVELRQRYPLAAVEARRALESRRTVGAMVVLP